MIGQSRNASLIWKLEWDLNAVSDLAMRKSYFYLMIFILTSLLSDNLVGYRILLASIFVFRNFAISQIIIPL